MQETVGTVVKTTDSVDPIALLTVLPLRRYASLACLKEIKAYLQAKCNSKTLPLFQEVWHSKTTLNSLHIRHAFTALQSCAITI